MANPLKGEVDFSVEDQTYRLRLSINEIIQVEDLLDIGIIALAGMFSTPQALKAGTVRAVLWGALREHHPDVDLLEAGEIMGRARLQPTIEHVAKALQAAFPPVEGKERPSQGKRQVGTGNAS